MYTIRNINRVYALDVAEIVLNVSTSNPFSDSTSNEVVKVAKGAHLLDEDLRKYVIAQHSLLDTDLTFETPPVVVEAPTTGE